MERARSSSARRRKRRPLDATQHVSPASELIRVALLVGTETPTALTAGTDVGEDEDAGVLVDVAVRMLRNPKNSVYHRAMAARALGLLMARDTRLTAHVRCMDTEPLVDALLQLVSYCRRQSNQSADMRRVHVNCCLVISMVMQEAPLQSATAQSSHLPLLVSLESALLAMPPQPTDTRSGFLSLTIDGRPESAPPDRPHSSKRGRRQSHHLTKAITPTTTTPTDSLIQRRVAWETAPSPFKQLAKGTVIHPNPSRGERSPGNVLKVNKTPDTNLQEEDRGRDSHPGTRQGRPATLPCEVVLPSIQSPTLMQSIEQRATPNRQFKMDRHRVVTPAMFGGCRKTPLPVISPGSVSSNNQSRHGTSQHDVEHVGEGRPLLAPPHISNILASGQMPVASAGYFHRHLHDDDQGKARARSSYDTSEDETAIRLRVVRWSEWQRQHKQLDLHQQPRTTLNTSSNSSTKVDVHTSVEERVEGEMERQDEGVDSTAMGTTPLPSVTIPVAMRLASASAVDVNAVNTPEYKRERLRAILTSPVEPLACNTSHLRNLAAQDNSAVLASLDAQLGQLKTADERARTKTSALIQKQRDELPLKFLFQLPGGAAYCRERMQRAMLRWAREFERNQQRMALIQWKALVEHCRFRERGRAYHRAAIEKRLRAALGFVMHHYQQDAIAYWREVVQHSIWHDRDRAVRQLQRQWRRRRALIEVLRRHDAHPFDDGHRDAFRDVCLAAPRHPIHTSGGSTFFSLPARIRDDRRRLWAAAALVQGVYRKRRFRLCLARYREAAIRLQALARGRAAYVQFRVLRHRLILFQAQVRMLHCYRAFQTLRAAALLVQMQYRCVRLRRLRRLVVRAHRRHEEHTLTAALSLQRVARGFLARRLAASHRREDESMFHAALVVQRAWYRRNNEWSTFLLLGCLREAGRDELIFERRVTAYTRRHRSRLLQRVFLAYRHRKRSARALQIQQIFRQWRAVRIVEQRRCERWAHRRISCFFRVRHAARMAAARRLQFWWLYTPRDPHRRLVDHIRDKRVALTRLQAFEQAMREKEAASRMQALARGRRGRVIARRERSARMLQRIVRLFLVCCRAQRERRRIKMEVAEQVVLSCMAAGLERIANRRTAVLHAAATKLQRVVRGDRCRSQLTRTMVRDELHARMARNLQLWWRHNSQQAKARRLIVAQRRRVMNPFRKLRSLQEVLQCASERVSCWYDLQDDICGMHAAEWLRRLGLGMDGEDGNSKVAKYLAICRDAAVRRRGKRKCLPTEKDTLSGDLDDGGLAALQEICLETETENGSRGMQGEASFDSNIESRARAVLKKLGVTDSDDRTAMATSLCTSHILRAAKKLRGMLSRDRKSLAREETRLQWRSERQRHAQEACDGAVSRLESVMAEIREFRNPPRALRAKRERADRAVQTATCTLDAAVHQRDVCQKRCSRAHLAISRLEGELADAERREVAAVFHAHNFRALSVTSSRFSDLARELFLATFPSMEARAQRFVAAIQEGAGNEKWSHRGSLTGSGAAVATTLTGWQLRRFLTAHGSSVGDVKTYTPTLTKFPAAIEVKRYDHVRLAAVLDLLQYACERMCELLHLPIECMINPNLRRLTSSIESQLLALLQPERRSARASFSSSRPLSRPQAIAERTATAAAGVQTLVTWSASATKVQAHVRRRIALRMVHAYRRRSLHEQLRDQYLAEARADYVTPLWERERDKERKELEVWSAQAALHAREQALADGALRFGFMEAWDDTTQTMVCYRRVKPHAHVGDDGNEVQEDEAYEYEYEYEYVSERPVYSVAEEDAVIRIQALARRFLVRTDLHRQQRDHRRRLQHQALEHAWLSKASERQQIVTLRVHTDINASIDVQHWLMNRSSTSVSDSDGFHARLLPLIADCERAYHRSARAEHRRHQLLPVLARPVNNNAHAQAILSFVDGYERLAHVTAPRVHTRTRLEYTRGALRFGWQRIELQASDQGRDEADSTPTTPAPRCYFLNVDTQDTSWDRPQYDSFVEEFAVLKIQSVGRVQIAKVKRDDTLALQSLVATAREGVERAAQIGWYGFGLEGMTTALYLARLGLAKYTPLLSTLAQPGLTARSPATITAAMLATLSSQPGPLHKLGCSKEELSVLREQAPVPVARKPPLFSSTVSLAPGTRHPFNYICSERVLTQLVAQRLTNQQGRVPALVRAVRGSRSPITYRQLEMHLRLYAGRPDDALNKINEIANRPEATQPDQERELLINLVRATQRCVVLAANTRLRGMQHVLSRILYVAQALAPRNTVSLSSAAPLIRINPEALQRGRVAAMARYPARVVKGLWEHDVANASPPDRDNGDNDRVDASSTAHGCFSCAQAALYLREEALERVLGGVRGVVVCQARHRMRMARRWFLALVAHRHASAQVLQCAWRVFSALEASRALRAQRCSPYEQRFDRVSATFFVEYTPTRERLEEEPRDHDGALMAVRPMVQDRLTKRWMLAWPHHPSGSHPRRGDGELEDNDAHDTGAMGDAPCRLCLVERAVRRCNECATAQGDFVDCCVACFYDTHADTATQWHTFTTLHTRRWQAATTASAIAMAANSRDSNGNEPLTPLTRAFHCIECKRLATQRCLTCHEHYCARCFARVHARGHRRRGHACEFYAAQARVCAECEARVAMWLCLVCQDALCDDCVTRTHHQRPEQQQQPTPPLQLKTSASSSTTMERPKPPLGRAGHALQLIQQAIDQDGGDVYCEQCHARRGDTACPFCGMALCQLCLTATDRHGVVCPETLRQARTTALLGPAGVCCECRKHAADRACVTCGDRYCSVRWMGNPGCFERFHARGQRANHDPRELTPEEAPSEDVLRELEELEELVRAKRRQDAERAEQEAARMAEALVLAQSTAGKAIKKPRKKAKKAKLQDSAACHVDGCRRARVRPDLPSCERHVTSQHALELTDADPLAAAKLLAQVEIGFDVRRSGKSKPNALQRGIAALRDAALGRRRHHRRASLSTPNSKQG